jgi:hypothetical protein
MTYVDGPGDGFAHQDCHDGYVVGEIVFTTNSSSSAPLQILTVSGTPDARSDSTSESQLKDSHLARSMKNPIRRSLFNCCKIPITLRTLAPFYKPTASLRRRRRCKVEELSLLSVGEPNPPALNATEKGPLEAKRKQLCSEKQV